MFRKAFVILLPAVAVGTPAGSGVGQTGWQTGSSPPDPLVQFMVDQVDAGRIYKLAGDLAANGL
jgi:hypothetical protein